MGCNVLDKLDRKGWMGVGRVLRIHGGSYGGGKQGPVTYLLQALNIKRALWSGDRWTGTETRHLFRKHSLSADLPSHRPGGLAPMETLPGSEVPHHPPLVAVGPLWKYLPSSVLEEGHVVGLTHSLLPLWAGPHVMLDP